MATPSVPMFIREAKFLVAPELPEMGPRYPEWILLSTRAYISDRVNAATVACSNTSDGHPIQVSLFAATPPAVSHLCVHCPGRETHQFSDNPGVIFSRDDLILLNVSFACGDMTDFFVYKAGPKTPSLVRIAIPDLSISSFLNTGIVCCGADHFAVAALIADYMTDMFELSVFNSKTRVWETRLLPLEPSESLCHPAELSFFPSKVIPLEGSLLGWVDLWNGILLCDILSDNPKLHYVPMPKPMPGNVALKGEGEPKCYRDVIGCGDLIKVVEVDYEYNGTEVADINSYVPEEWTLVTLTRRLDSREWKRGHEVNIGDITVSQDFYGHTDVLPRFCENGTPSLKKMPLGFPTLCEWNNMVYFMCKVSLMDYNGWVVAVDMNSNKLQAVSSFCGATLPGFSTAYYPSSFTKYLNNSGARPEIELNAQTSNGLASTDTEDSIVDD
ncbi:hypothetical protein PAHAL_4G330200 [Panicum hallii]|uniref:DUF1618 domain-containing protein n=1 Tax=Panicum hallii TaxID=206008 RepID=A0A2T8JEV9_9POAL|nr:uncharacterized protein LOC112889705 [Panicum hallii]PVH48445.1 hypothetical protein PAHAL_4G330200 [Panicum hallii]